MSQLHFVYLDSLVKSDHPYRNFKTLLPMVQIRYRLREVERVAGANGYGVTPLFLGLLLQFMKDLSDRELERYLQENMAAKWFCGFELIQETPSYSLFSRVRKRIGTKRLSKLYSWIRDDLKSQGYLSEVFTFVDATHLISKANCWKERDAALKAKYDKLNNDTLPKVAVDKQARIGCKGKDKYWYGYKQQTSVDMQSGLINKVAIAPANETDAQGMKRVCPSQGATYVDKGYCTKPAKQAAARKQVYLAAIKKNNMKEKNQDLDRWISKIRAPYERVFSKLNHRVRYRGIKKNQFAAFMQAMAFNLKRMRVLWIEGAGPPLAALS
jgi:transposase, IS5 family